MMPHCQRLQVDASKAGMGDVLFQNGKLVAFTSKALTKAEQSYTPIEPEMLAVIISAEIYVHSFLCD